MIQVIQTDARQYMVVASEGVSTQKMDAAMRKFNPYARIVTGAMPDSVKRRFKGEVEPNVRFYSV